MKELLTEHEANAKNLKAVLWSTLLDVRAEKIPVQQANSVSSTANSLVSVVKLELNISRALKVMPTQAVKDFAQL